MGNATFPPGVQGKQDGREHLQPQLTRSERRIRPSRGKIKISVQDAWPKQGDTLTYGASRAPAMVRDSVPMVHEGAPDLWLVLLCLLMNVYSRRVQRQVVPLDLRS